MQRDAERETAAEKLAGRLRERDGHKRTQRAQKTGSRNLAAGCEHIGLLQCRAGKRNRRSLTTDGHGAANPKFQIPNPNKIAIGTIPKLAGYKPQPNGI